MHEGVDFYSGFACVAIQRGTQVLAARSGMVVRADWGYVEMTAEEKDRLLDLSEQQGYTDAATLDRFRGRQVWLDHGGGVVTRYAHLSGVAEGIADGVSVEAGQAIGFVGNSGTPDGVSDPGVENHLHFEIRVGDRYVGQGLSLEETKAVLEGLFSP
jgi:murein DD-endopeptidase MepM/ murein hydrolase activator NlpD